MKRLVHRHTGLLVWLLLCIQPSWLRAQDKPEPLQLAFALELQVSIAPALVVGETPHGVRRIVPITGGTFSGPNLKGTIVDGGADWQLVRSDGVAELNALYTLKTDDGALIYIHNTGIRVATPEVARRLANGEQVSPTAYYFRAIPTFETPPGKYDWLTKAVFISRGFRNPTSVVIQVWKVL